MPSHGAETSCCRAAETIPAFLSTAFDGARISNMRNVRQFPRCYAASDRGARQPPLRKDPESSRASLVRAMLSVRTIRRSGSGESGSPFQCVPWFLETLRMDEHFVVRYIRFKLEKPSLAVRVVPGFFNVI